MDRRDGSRDRGGRGGPSFNTNSTDPKLLYSRVFIGNLATDKLERDDLHSMFDKYGKILGITMFKGYGFVQYDNEKNARAAVAAENGNNIKGRPVDVKIAAEGKKRAAGGGGGGGGDRGYSGRRSPPSSQCEQGQADPGSFVATEDPYGRDRSPIRDPYRDLAAREMDDPFRRRGMPPADPYFDRYDPYRRDPYAGLDPLRDAYAAPPAAMPAFERPPFDCDIIITSLKCRGYAELIESRLKPGGLLTHITIIPEEAGVTMAVEDVAQRQIPFAIVINEQNDAHRSLTVNILHGTPQEHRNMPFEDAMTLVTRNFETYLQEMRDKAAGIPTASKTDPPEFIPPDQNTHYLLNLLADNRILTVEELDTVITYLKKRRDRVVALKGGAETGTQQQQLQSKILSILNGSGTGEPQAQALSTQYPTRGASVGQPTSTSTSINFDNPSVQKALDNLISSGPNLLRNIGGGAGQQSQAGYGARTDVRPQGFGGQQSSMRGSGGQGGVQSLMGTRTSSTGLASLAQYGQY